MCLESKNKHFPQTDDTAQGPHMSCLNSDIVIESFDKKAPKYRPSVIGWKRFKDNIFLVWPHSREALDLFSNCMNNIDSKKKIQFTMELAKDVSEFLNLRLIFGKEHKHISVETFCKVTKFYIRTS